MILVTGAGGYIGRRLVQRLLTEGYHVRCLYTSQHARFIPDHPSIEAFVQNEPDSQFWSSLVDGIHTIIHLRSSMWWGRTVDQKAIEIEGTRKLIYAAKSAEVGRITLISHLNATPTSGIETLNTKSIQEQLIRESGLAYTIIQSSLVFGELDSFISHLAAIFYLNPFVYSLPSRGEFLQQPLYVSDLIDALILSLDSIEMVDKTVPIGGPELLTFSELILTMMRVLSVRRTMIPIPPYILRWINKVVSIFLPRTLITEQWFDLVFTSRTTDPVNFVRFFGMQPRRFEDTLMQYLPNQNHFGLLLRRSFRRAPRRTKS